MLVILIGSSGAVYLLMQRHLLTLNDSALREELDELTDEVKRVEARSSLPDVLRLRFPGHEGYELQVGTVAGESLFRSVGIGSKGLPRPVVLRPGIDGPTYESVMLDDHTPVRLASRVVDSPSARS